MSRIGWVLVSLLCVLLVALWYFTIFSPTSEDIEDVRAQTEQVEREAEQQRNRAEALRQVRAEAPEAEAQLAFGRTLIPDQAAMPSLFRQLQQAADDSGARLVTITPSSASEESVEGVDFASIPVTMMVEGSYFQLVDVARRIEDPTLTPRALRWQGVTIGISDFPTLNANFTGQVFARNVDDLPELPEEPEEPDDEEDDEDPDELDDTLLEDES